uniref:Hypotheticial protein n=1 Tax=Schistosoma japonicum TaxID=6182 RepID=C1LEV7_SCHJA|nr:hypotheticial protein [Schistosoma japonicum]
MRETDVNVDFSSLYNNQFGLLFGRSDKLILATSVLQCGKKLTNILFLNHFSIQWFILLETTYGAIRSRGPWWSAVSFAH